MRFSACPLSFLLGALLFVVASLPAYAAEVDRDSVSRLATEQNLADSPAWSALLHYRPAMRGRVSLVDDTRFFLAPEGKTDPRAELLATIDALFDNTTSPPARCRFPARTAWLTETLALSANAFTPAACFDVDNIIRTVNPRSTTLVFASGHMNSPASMFGHTFLRLDGAMESPLLSFAVNYSATIGPDDGGIPYAIKGLAGSFSGFYSLMPYYLKTREYADMESRDLWEYRLDLTEEETRRLLLHAFELRDIASDYYFLDENCSWRLLFLLDATRPSARLVDKTDAIFVTPVATLRAVIESGMASTPVFRPSLARKIRHSASLLSPASVDAAALLSESGGTVTPELAALPEPERAQTLDLAASHLQHRFLRRDVPQAEYQSRYLALLTERSRTSSTSMTDAAPPIPPPPEASHGDRRISISGGARDGDAFVEASIRPAWHDLLDPEDGFVRGAQIAFGDVTLRTYIDDGETRLQRFDLVDIVSLSPHDRLFRPASWKMSAGTKSIVLPNERETTVAYGNSGGGFTWDLPSAGLISLIGEAEVIGGKELYGDAALSGGASATALLPLGRNIRGLLKARLLIGIIGDRDAGGEALAEGSLSVAPNRSFELRGSAARTARRGITSDEIRISASVFF